MLDSTRSDADLSLMNDTTSAAPTPARRLLRPCRRPALVTLGAGALGVGVASSRGLPSWFAAVTSATDVPVVLLVVFVGLAVLLYVGALVLPTIVMSWIAAHDPSAREDLQRLNDRTHATVVDLRHGRASGQEPDRADHGPPDARDRPPAVGRPSRPPSGASPRPSCPHPRR